MTLKEFKDYIKSFPKNAVFKCGISEPFSWRGSYDEVAFSVVESSMGKSVILKRINKAYTETFFGYKGGAYEYSDHTTVNFEEEGSRNYSNGRYTAEMISQLENTEQFLSQEERLVKLAFC